MINYVLVSDSTLDLPEKYCNKQNIHIVPMPFIVNGQTYKHYIDTREMSYKEFYLKLEKGESASTSQINYKQFYEYFEDILKLGKDIIYISFSAEMSGTYNTSKIAVTDLLEKYPNRKITVIDSKCASVGEGLLAYNASLRMDKGYGYNELCNWIVNNRSNICHWFVVDDLEQLKRGGRISPLTATIGKMLQIKPLLTVNNKGGLETVSKIRGSSKVFDTLVSKFINDKKSAVTSTVVVGHANCYENAVTLKKMLMDTKQVKKVIISDIGPVIGSHVGSGMLAVTFTGTRKLK